MLVHSGKHGVTAVMVLLCALPSVPLTLLGGLAAGLRSALDFLRHGGIVPVWRGPRTGRRGLFADDAEAAHRRVGGAFEEGAVGDDLVEVLDERRVDQLAGCDRGDAGWGRRDQLGADAACRVARLDGLDQDVRWIDAGDAGDAGAAGELVDDDDAQLGPPGREPLAQQPRGADRAVEQIGPFADELAARAVD